MFFIELFQKGIDYTQSGDSDSYISETSQKTYRYFAKVCVVNDLNIQVEKTISNHSTPIIRGSLSPLACVRCYLRRPRAVGTAQLGF